MKHVPDRIGRYEIVSLLGEGGMGVVYLARDPAIGRQVAIKVHRADTDDLRERFLREARAVGRINHPNIVSIYDVGQHEGQPFLVMEFVAGPTLSEELQKTPAMTLLRRLDIVEALANALDFAHGLGLVHRDVKPSNVIIDPDGVPHLLDFGIARLANSGMTLSGSMLGTPQYMSPEQLRGTPVDRRSDIFSLGLLLYEVVSSTRAFGVTSGIDLASVMFAIVHSEPPPLRELFTNLDPELDRIVSKALQKDPNLRYQTAAEMAAALAALRGRLAASGGDVVELIRAPSSPRARTPDTNFDSVARPPSTDATSPLPPPTRGRRRRGAWPTLKRWLLDRLRPSPPSPPSATLPPAPPSSPPIATRPTSVQPPALSPSPRPAPPTPPHTDVDSILSFGQTVIVTGPAPHSPGSAREAADVPSPAASDGTVYIGPESANEESGPDARLLIVRSPDARRTGRTIDVSTTPFTLGRHVDALLAIADPGWSREHAIIEFQDGGYAIRDLGSSNGTYVNGRRVQGVQPLFFGASIRIGDTVLSFTYGHDLTLPDLTGVEIAHRYVLRRLIRESAKAAMYVASDKNVPREVATKLLSPKLMRMSGYREQFAREAETASQLQHPHICRVIDSGLTSVPMGDGTTVQTHFLCFDLMAGGNLAERLETLSDIGLQEISQWIETLGIALHYAHERGIIHGDLKPSAVVFDLAGHLYLTDFAIAQRALNVKGQHFMGSPAYVAPEQWENGAITPATDQFAFAVIAYYLITGSKPYEGLDHPEIRAQQFRRGPEAAHELAARNGRPSVQRIVSDVLRRGLATAGSDRYATTEQFARALTTGLSEGRRFGETPQVFISYDREQSGGWARYFADKLKDKHGLRVFMDTLGLDRAGRFPPRLVKAIEDCDVFICFLAGSTLTSKWVNEEIRLAHEQHKLMIPVFQETYVEPETPPGSPPLEALMSHQGIKLFDVSGHYVDAAVSDLAAMIKGTISGT